MLLAERFLGVAHQAQDCKTSVVIRSAVGRYAHAAGRPVEQADPEDRLQFLNQCGRGGFRHAEAVRSPIYSTGVGLLLYARDNTTAARGRRPSGKTVIDRMKSWFQGNF